MPSIYDLRGELDRRGAVEALNILNSLVPPEVGSARLPGKKCSNDGSSLGDRLLNGDSISFGEIAKSIKEQDAISDHLVKILALRISESVKPSSITQRTLPPQALETHPTHSPEELAFEIHVRKEDLRRQCASLVLEGQLERARSLLECTESPSVPSALFEQKMWQEYEQLGRSLVTQQAETAALRQISEAAAPSPIYKSRHQLEEGVNTTPGRNYAAAPPPKSQPRHLLEEGGAITGNTTSGRQLLKAPSAMPLTVNKDSSRHSLSPSRDNLARYEYVDAPIRSHVRPHKSFERSFLHSHSKQQQMLVQYPHVEPRQPNFFERLFDSLFGSCMGYPASNNGVEKGREKNGR